jgi:hypothetical protein
MTNFIFLAFVRLKERGPDHLLNQLFEYILKEVSNGVPKHKMVHKALILSNNQKRKIT